MSHELRTPLNSMLILSRLLAENESGRWPSAEVEFARTIHSAGDDLLALINDILDLSKVEAGRMELDLAAVALSDVCQDAERAFRHIAEQKGLSFGVEIDPALAVVDRVRRAAARPGAEEPAVERVQVHPRGRGDAVAGLSRGAAGAICFTVSDTGVGIPEDKLNLIFEAFQQADGTTSRKYGGTGLGLSISRELARLLGGELRVESEPARAAASHSVCRSARISPAPPSTAPARPRSRRASARRRCAAARCS